MSEDLGVLLIKMNSEKKRKPSISNKNSIFKKFNFSLKNEQDL